MTYHVDVLTIVEHILEMSCTFQSAKEAFSFFEKATEKGFVAQVWVNV